MPKYMLVASFSAEGARGILKEGGTSRRKNAEDLAKQLGGSIDAFYFAFGSEDAYVIADLPDEATAAALSLSIGASGAVRTRTVVLITPEQIDQASKKSESITYRPPGA